MSEGDWMARLTRHGERDYWSIAFRQDGVQTLGEATAMPGYSPETAMEQTQSVTGLLEARPALEGATQKGVETALRGLALTPAVRFAAETALARWSARSEGKTLAVWWGAEGASEAQCNGLVPRGLSDDAATALAREQFSAGVCCLKVKVDGVPADDARIRAIVETVPEAKIRLDANAAWGDEQARAFLSGLADLSIEYCEQPLAPDAAPATLGTPIALDETLRHEETAAAWLGCEGPVLHAYLSNTETLPRMQPHQDVRALVLKPSVLGGTARCLRWAALARACGLAVVFTHTFEGPLGLAACRAAALAANVGRTPQGLAGYAMLDECAPPTRAHYPTRFDIRSVESALTIADAARV